MLLPLMLAPAYKFQCCRHCLWRLHLRVCLRRHRKWLLCVNAFSIKTLIHSLHSPLIFHFLQSSLPKNVLYHQKECDACVLSNEAVDEDLTLECADLRTPLEEFDSLVRRWHTWRWKDKKNWETCYDSQPERRSSFLGRSQNRQGCAHYD